MKGREKMKLNNLTALLLAAAMLLSLASCAMAEPEDLVDINTIPLSAACMQIEGDAENEFSICSTSTISGYYTEAIPSGETVYNIRRYIPVDCQLNCPCVQLVIPSGADPYDFLAASGWKAVADKERLTVVLMIPQNEANAWGAYDETVAYFKAIGANQLCGKFRYCRRDALYMVGYGDGADIAARWVMEDATNYSSAAFFGGNGVDEAYVEAIHAAPSKEEGITMGQIPVNVFIVSEGGEDVERLISFYREANKTLTDSTVLELNGITFDRYYAPDEDADVGQPNAEPVCGVAVATAGYDAAMSDAAAQSIWTRMGTVRKWTGFGNHLARYYENPYDGIHFTEYTAKETLGHLIYGGDILDENGNAMPGNYYNRQWFVYVPDSVKEALATNPEAKFPVIFNFSGNSAFGTHSCQSQGWDIAAQNHQCILVLPSQTLSFPNGTSNLGWFCETTAERADSILFMDELYDWLLNDSEYADIIDRDRLYCTGHSMGGMFTLYMSMYRPQYFAATAPCSEMIQPADNAYHTIVTDYDLPLLIGVGQKDKYMAGLCFGSSPENPTGMGGNGKDKIAYFVNRYNLNGPAWEDCTFAVPDAVCSNKVGRLNEYQYTTEKGYIMFEAVEVVGMEHNVIPEECELIWERLFSHYTRDFETKVVYYDGEVLDTAANLALYESLLSK